MTNSEFKALLQQYTSGNCTEEEKALIEAWYLKFEHDETLELSEQQIDDVLAMEIPVRIKAKQGSLWKWVGTAAAILILAATGIYFGLDHSVPAKQAIVQVQSDVEPGTNKAILTLATGKKIMVQDAKTGVLANEANATIRKTEDGQLVYSAVAKGEDAAAILLNTMTTPRGGQYQLTLADGTRVWLNAASSITYPTRFAGGARKVEITGEVYFEVAHQAKQPFHVIAKGQDVVVLGTHFNINAYADEPVIKTTLLEGSIRINAGSESGLLKPGEQANVSSNGLKVMQADIEETMAWHEGDFVFNSQSLEEIMRTVSRWYAIDIDYERYKSNKQTFTGVVSRSRNLSAVINMLKKSTSTLKFEIKGKNIVVSN